MTFQILNTGLADLYNARVFIEGKGLFPVQDAFLGNIPAGESKEGEMQIFIGTLDMDEEGKQSEEKSEKYGAVNGTVTFSFEDENGEIKEQKSDIHTEIKEPQIVELKIEKEKTETNQWWITMIVLLVLTLVLVIIGLYLRMQYFKKRWISMKKRNIYKDIVVFAVLCITIFFLMRFVKEYQKEEKSYGFTLMSEGSIQPDVVKEFEKIKGLIRFEPYAEVPVTIRIGSYTLETNLMVADIEDYPLEWKTADEEIILGNTSVLFFGEDSFSGFTDWYGNTVEKSRIQKWIKDYQNLELTITDENKKKRTAKISGIIKSPGNLVCMDKGQLEALEKKRLQITGGYMEISGYQNVEEAKEILEKGGFVVESKE